MISEAEAFSLLTTRWNVSRETLEQLKTYVALLEKWNPKINLVSKSTLPAVWERHILDSVQLHQLIPSDAASIVDVGSGGGFPGMVLAILLQESHPLTQVALVESDRRKCVFLHTVLTQLQLKADVLADRIESLAPMAANVMTSRALAPLDKLLGIASYHLDANGKALFPKGANADQEINEALASWRFDLQKKPSETSSDAVVLEISNIRPR